MIVVCLVSEVVQTEDGVVVLLLPLLRVVVERVGVLLLLPESVELRAEDLLSVALRGQVGGVLGVNLVVLVERSLEVLSDGGADERGSSREDRVCVGSCRGIRGRREVSRGRREGEGRADQRARKRCGLTGDLSC